jgi:capsular polysaccharide transport system permease protein
MRELRNLRRALVSQKRILSALFMREIQVRWGRRNLGFAWLFAEPLVFAFPVLLMWSMMRSPIEHGLPMMAFVWSGYLPLLMFRHTAGRALYVIRTNAAMLYHRSVTPLDLVISRCGMEMIGGLAATTFSFAILYMFGVLAWPHDLPLFMVGNLVYGMVVIRCSAAACGRERAQRDRRTHLDADLLYVFADWRLYVYGRLAAERTPAGCPDDSAIPAFL